jgi:hypothetical protein
VKLNPRRLPPPFTQDHQRRVGEIVSDLRGGRRDARLEAELRDLLTRKTLWCQSVIARAEEFDRKHKRN